MSEEKEGAKECPFCGLVVDEEDKYCSECGTDLIRDTDDYNY